MPKRAKIDYAELCDVLRIKINHARAPRTDIVRKPGKALTEPQTAVSATGSQVGDPRAGEARRLAEIDGACVRGTVKVPVKGDKGRIKLTEVPATENNVRKALDYWRTRKPRTETSRVAQNENVSSLVRRLEALMDAQTVTYDTEAHAIVVTSPQGAPEAMRASVSPEGFTQHMLPGPAIVQGPNMKPEQKMFRPRKNGEYGEPEVAASFLDGSLTERLDRTVADERPKAHWTKSQRKNWRRKQQRQALRTAQARVTELEALLAAR